MNRSTILCALSLAIGVAACGTEATAPDADTPAPNTLVVTSGADDGPGSLREALDRASADPSVAAIELAPGVTSVVPTRALSFRGSQLLTINGRGATLTGQTLLLNAPAGVVIRHLTVADAPGNGIEINVPAGATGDYVVRLQHVTVTGAVGHGVLVEDQVDNSDASIVLEVLHGTFTGNGNVAGASVSDRDGIRVNEGGAGSISARIVQSSFIGNGADGVELDEKGDGSVALESIRSHYDRNGPFDPADLDDGIDIDEDEAGDIVARFVGSTANGNFDQGFDLNENGAGNLDVTMVDSEASGNGQEGIDLEEDDDVDGGGDLKVRLTRVTANGNGFADPDDLTPGMKIEEDGEGTLFAELVRVTASNNATFGLSLEQQSRTGDAAGTATLVRFVGEGNPDGPFRADATVTVTTRP